MSLYKAAYAHVDCQTCTSEILTRIFTSKHNPETPTFSLSQAEKSEDVGFSLLYHNFG